MLRRLNHNERIFMKTKLVIWGTNAEDKKILIGIELLADKNKVNIFTFPGENVTEEFNQKMMQEWRDGSAVEFPEGHTATERELSITESLLPDTIKVERGDLIQRAQTEWHFIVLSSKLNATYQSELHQIRDRIEALEKFDSKVWETLKSFWSKVQTQVKERNLFKEHADTLRDITNELFAQMKNLRSRLDEEFKQVSHKHQEEFFTKLDIIGEKISNGLHLQSLFDELKTLQRNFKETKFTREHRSKVWQKLDGTFKTLKEKRFGGSHGGNDNRSPMERLKRRYDGLISAIEKMERSIKRDQNDLQFEDKRIANTDGQLEAQIRQAKVLMIEERIRSKEEKLKEMLKTKVDLEKRIENQKVKDTKRLEREKLEEAKKAAQAKIASDIKEAANARKTEDDKLVKAAAAISNRKQDQNEHPSQESGSSDTEPGTNNTAKQTEPSVNNETEEKSTQETSSISSTIDKANQKIVETISDVTEADTPEESPNIESQENIEEGATVMDSSTEIKEEEPSLNVPQLINAPEEIVTEATIPKVPATSEEVTDLVEESSSDALSGQE